MEENISEKKRQIFYCSKKKKISLLFNVWGGGVLGSGNCFHNLTFLRQLVLPLSREMGRSPRWGECLVPGRWSMNGHGGCGWSY